MICIASEIINGGRSTNGVRIPHIFAHDEDIKDTLEDLVESHQG